MRQYVPVFILVLCCFSLPAYGQRVVPGATPPKSSRGPKTPPRPPKPPVPPTPKNGTLSVVTNPPAARIVIKDKDGNKIRNGDSVDGNYHTDLPFGAYTIEVSADKYVPQIKQVHIERAKPTPPIQATLTPTNGSLLINLGAVGSDAEIFIDDKKFPVASRKSDNEIELGDIPAGPHTLRITHPSIAPFEAQITVEGGKTVPMNPTFKSAIASLLIKSEPGASIFVDGKLEGRTTSSGELQILITPSRHTVRAEKDKFEAKETISDFKVGEQPVDLKLLRIKSSPEFADSFQEGKTFWDAPRSWQVNHGQMTVKGQEIGLARNNASMNVYDDFKMTLDVGFANQKGAVWILRARDKKNYYLFQLSGPRSGNSKRFRSYICQNGQLNLLRSDPVIEDLSRPNDSFMITIEAKGNTIKHFIQLKSNPAAGSEPLSTLTDNTFSFGGIGFGTVDDEEFEVFFVNVTPESPSSR